MSRFSGRQAEDAPTRLPAMRGKWPSFDRLNPAIATTHVEVSDNPFHYVEVEGPALARQGLDIEGIMAAAIDHAGRPRPLGPRGDNNLRHYAEHIQELHGTQSGGEQ